MNHWILYSIIMYSVICLLVFIQAALWGELWKKGIRFKIFVFFAWPFVLFAGAVGRFLIFLHDLNENNKI